jgi:D-alanyl-D-alanine carboxypeptidase
VSKLVKAPARAIRRGVLAAAAVAAMTGLVVGGLPVTASADIDPVQKSLDKLVSKHKFPGVMASVRDADGNVTDYVAGVASLKTKTDVPVDGYGRIGSASKMFTAVVLLQLAGEGKVKLDAPIERYLPKLVRGKGIDGRKITTRQLLQHTAGLPNYTDIIPDYLKIRHRTFSERQLVDLALTKKASFAPGKKWAYSNTGYILAGMVAEKATGQSISALVEKRVIDKLGLEETYWPGKGVETLRAPHPHGYLSVGPKKPLLDYTKMDPSWGGAAGQLIATPSDLNRFLVGLQDGKLLKPKQFKEMTTTVKTTFPPSWNWRYGLGLIKMKLSCGGTAIGHGGDIHGYETRDAVTPDGRAVTVIVTSLPGSEAAGNAVIAAVDSALCAGK